MESLFLRSSKFWIMPQTSKKTIHFKSGQKWPKINHLAFSKIKSKSLRYTICVNSNFSISCRRKISSVAERIPCWDRHRGTICLETQHFFDREIQISGKFRRRRWKILSRRETDRDRTVFQPRREDIRFLRTQSDPSRLKIGLGRTFPGLATTRGCSGCSLCWPSRSCP